MRMFLSSMLPHLADADPEEEAEKDQKTKNDRRPLKAVVKQLRAAMMRQVQPADGKGPTNESMSGGMKELVAFSQKLSGGIQLRHRTE